MIKQTPVKGKNAVKVSFVLPKESVDGKVSVVGDFNDWDPAAHPLRLRNNGTRSASVTLSSGRRYTFRYVSDSGQWLNDSAAHDFEPNGYGETNCVLLT